MMKNKWIQQYEEKRYKLQTDLLIYHINSKDFNLSYGHDCNYDDPVYAVMDLMALREVVFETQSRSEIESKVQNIIECATDFYEKAFKTTLTSTECF